MVLGEDGKLTTAGRFNPFEWKLDEDVQATDVEPQTLWPEEQIKKAVHQVLLFILAKASDWLEDEKHRELVKAIIKQGLPFQKGKTFPITAHPKQQGGEMQYMPW